MANQIIEVNGVKLEISLDHARKIEAYKIGDPVKILVEQYGDKFASRPGVIIGFDSFTNLPTIVVLYLDNEYSPDLKFAYINANSKGIEIAPMLYDEIKFSHDEVIRKLDDRCAAKRCELADLELKRDLFSKRFSAAFGSTWKQEP